MTTASALRKSARNYWVLIMLIPRGPHMTRTPEFKNAAKYRRELDSQYGKEAVRKEIEYVRDRANAEAGAGSETAAKREPLPA